MNKSPDAFRTISEVAELLETPAHVLRFWESRFPQIRPVKRAGGRRYYRPADVALLTGIKRLLHDEGLTIRGVQKILREQGVRHVSGVPDEANTEEDDAALEAALAASGGVPDDAEVLPAAEAETAQIIALQSALRQSEKQAPAVADNLFAYLDDTPAEEEKAAALSAQATLAEEEIAPPPEVDVPDAGDTRADDEDLSDLVQEIMQDQAVAAEPLAEEDIPEEAPMAVWAEPAAPPPAEPAAPTGAPTFAGLKITRIGPSNVPAPAPPVILPGAKDRDGDADTLAATMAHRLRHTKVASLSPSERATLSILRAKARSLRDRLATAPRSAG